MAALMMPKSVENMLENIMAIATVDVM